MHLDFFFFFLTFYYPKDNKSIVGSVWWGFSNSDTEWETSLKQRLLFCLRAAASRQKTWKRGLRLFSHRILGEWHEGNEYCCQSLLAVHGLFFKAPCCLSALWRRKRRRRRGDGGWVRRALGPSGFAQIWTLLGSFIWLWLFWLLYVEQKGSNQTVTYSVATENDCTDKMSTIR